MAMRFWGLLGLVMLCASPAMAATTVLLQGEPGDYVVGNNRLLFSSETASIFTKATPTRLTVSIDSGWYQLEFEVPRGHTLSELASYHDATRHPFNAPTRPGLSVFGGGVGCNEISGWFAVRDAAFDGEGQILRLAIDLLQYCDNAKGALFGAVRINSDVPLEDPAPHAVAGAPAQSFGGETVMLDASRSYQLPSKGALQYQWTQTAGLPVTLSGANTQKPSFVAPFVAPAGEELEFQLTVTDPAGAHSQDQVSVGILSKSGVQTALYFRSEPGDYIGQGETSRRLPSDGDMQVTANFRNGLQIFFEEERPFILNFAAPQGQDLQIGSYTGAQRSGFTDPGRPGLSVSGDGRGCNEVTGQFVVRHLLWNSSGEPTAFAIDFEQHCEGMDAALFGTALYNYVPTGLPVAKAGADQVAVARRGVVLDGSTSTADGSLRHYRWRQLAGTPVVLSGADGSRPTFTAPATPGLLSFQLLVVDDKELTAVDTVDVLVEPPAGGGGGSGGGAPAPALLLSLAALAWWSRRGNRMR